MATLTVQKKSNRALLSWAYLFAILIVGALLYFGLEAIAPPPDSVDKDLVHQLDFAAADAQLEAAALWTE